MSADKAPAEKLPLAVRKNVRDEWENKKGELETQVSDILGVPWTFDINPLVVYPYAEDNSFGKDSLGACIRGYAEGFIWYLKYFISSAGDGGKAELNSVVTKHTITLIASTANTYCGADILDGILRLQFHPNNLGTNIDKCAENLKDVLSKAPQPEGAPILSFAARASIKADYEAQIVPILEKCQKLLENPNLKFEPDFDAQGTAFKGSKDVRNDWETNLGDFAKRYFESFKDVLEREKFGDDEMLREGFAEAIPGGVVKLRVVEKLKQSYNEIVLEDGALIIQTTPESWGTNIHYAAEKLVDSL